MQIQVCWRSLSRLLSFRNVDVEPELAYHPRVLFRSKVLRIFHFKSTSQVGLMHTIRVGVAGMGRMGMPRLRNVRFIHGPLLRMLRIDLREKLAR